ncbi:MAG: tRNA lysidine(34) synthetase TilS, partial [Oscillospiraceae bacterium]
MQNKVLEAIEKYKLINLGDSVTVALSGGADSVALLLVLLKLQEKLGISIDACHVNHNLRGEEAKRDEAFCKELCEEKNVKLFIKSVDVLAYAKTNSVSTELAARELRYSALCQVANGKIATAHTLSDSVETALFNLARGTGLRGLMGINPCRDNIIRPLTLVGREEIEAFLASENQSFVNDSTNFKNDFARNKIRNKVIPVLKEINPSLEQ